MNPVAAIFVRHAFGFHHPAIGLLFVFAAFVGVAALVSLIISLTTK